MAHLRTARPHGVFRLSVRDGMISAPRPLRRQLVRQLRPLSFYDRPHLIGDDRDLLNLQHGLVQPP